MPRNSKNVVDLLMEDIRENNLIRVPDQGEDSGRDSEVNILNSAIEDRFLTRGQRKRKELERIEQAEAREQAEREAKAAEQAATSDEAFRAKAKQDVSQMTPEQLEALQSEIYDRQYRLDDTDAAPYVAPELTYEEYETEMDEADELLDSDDDEDYDN